MMCETYRDTAALEAAFRATIYRVKTPEACFDLRIGVADSDLDNFLRAQNISTWGIVTACNPGAVRLSEDKNRRLQAELSEKLRSLGLRFYAACNLDPQAIWPPEPGNFILQIDQAGLRRLAEEFSQIAAVWGKVGMPPRLLWKHNKNDREA
jgi:hypothetical protein